MKYLAIILILVLCLIHETSYAAKAVAIVINAGNIGDQVLIQVSVAENTSSLTFTTSFTVIFTNSANQINADIKQRVRDELTQMGVILTVNDIFLFGGAQ